MKFYILISLITDIGYIPNRQFWFCW